MSGSDTDLGGAIEIFSGERTIDEVAIELSPRLRLVTSHILLSKTERDLQDALRREDKLKSALAKYNAPCDIVLIDCPPSRSLLTVNALSASTHVLVPTRPQITDVKGLIIFLDTIEQITDAINPDLEILGVLFNEYDSRLVHHQSVEKQLSNAMTILKPRISRSIRIAEAGIHGEAMVDYDPTHPQLDNYRQLAEVLINA